MKLAFIGLGVMGYPMAGHLTKMGHDVTVYNRTVEKAEQWSNEYSGHHTMTPAEAAQGADMVMLCVGNDDDVRSVVYGDTGVLAGMQAGTVLIDHTTASSELASELYDACAKQGVEFLDAPVSGGQAGAENGQLTIMVGGNQSTFDRAKDVLASYGKKVTRLGDAGSGQRCKMVNQLCIAGILQGLSEGIRLAKASGLDIDTVVEVLSGGAAQSWQLENRARTMAKGEFDFGFAIDWMRKDLAICFAEAERLGIDLPLAHMVDGYYEELQQMGGSRWDTSALIKRL